MKKLDNEIRKSTLQLATDSYEMSVGELMNIYRDEELIVNPEFQRLFRWDIYQKSHLIESLLIGVPIPSIFVFEKADGKWELVDGLQRVSTIFEFAGLLRRPDGQLLPGSVLQGTRYLPSLEGVTWAGSADGANGIGSSNQLTIKRSRITLQILKKTSDEKAKYDLFQRLNSHGSTATPQELRNCVLYMIDEEYFRKLRKLADWDEFNALLHLTDTAKDNQAAMDYVTRFMVFTYIEYEKKWDIEEYLDNGIIELFTEYRSDLDSYIDVFERTVSLLREIGEDSILRRYKDGKFQGKVGQAAFETIFIGIAQNIEYIENLKNRTKAVRSRIEKLWTDSNIDHFTRAGQRGTDRIQKTIAFGEDWFSK